MIAAANLGAQILGVLSLPILSRLFSPEDFGILTMYTVLHGVGLSIASGRLDWIVPNVATDRRARRLLWVGGVFVVSTTVLTSIGIWILGDPIVSRLGPSMTIGVLWLLPLGLAAGGVNLLLQAWCVLHGDLTDVSRARVWQAVTTLLASLAVGVLCSTTFGLVLAYVLGFIAAASTMAMRSRHGPSPWVLPRASHLRETFRMYSGHIAANMSLGLVNNITTSLILILLIAWYDNEVVGWYGLVFRVAAAPIGLVTQALVKSFWTDAAALVKTDPGRLREFYIGAVLRLSVVGCFVVVVALFAPVYVPPIFGREEWTGAGVLLASASPYLFALVVFSPTTHLVVYMKGHWQVASDLATVVGAATAFSYFAHDGHEAWVAILAASFTLLAGYTVRFWLHLYANRALLSSRESTPGIPTGEDPPGDET